MKKPKKMMNYFVEKSHTESLSTLNQKMQAHLKRTLITDIDSFTLLYRQRIFFSQSVFWPEIPFV